jgi:acyl dehydratase
MADDEKIEVQWKSAGVLDAESVAKHRARIGRQFKATGLNEEATKDTIRHFADGIGDPNPLWRNEEYAKKTRIGTITAPPSFLFSVFVGVVQQGLAGVHAFHSGSDWEFYRPMLRGDSFRVECTFSGLDEKSTDFADTWLVEHYDSKYYNQKGQLVAINRPTQIRATRSGMKKSGKYTRLQLPHPWTEEEALNIEDQGLAEEIRGASPRFWEDVKVGEELPPLVKGPISMTDEIAWLAGGATQPFQANSVAYALYRKISGWAFFHPITHAHEIIESVHIDPQAAATTGLPYPYDFGAQRHSWLMQSVTHWMGDDGFLKRSHARYSRFLYLSDAVWVKGKVLRKYIDGDGDFCVDIESTAINQRNENALHPALCTVALPSREKNVWPLERRIT